MDIRSVVTTAAPWIALAAWVLRLIQVVRKPRSDGYARSSRQVRTRLVALGVWAIGYLAFVTSLVLAIAARAGDRPGFFAELSVLFAGVGIVSITIASRVSGEP